RALHMPWRHAVKRRRLGMSRPPQEADKHSNEDRYAVVTGVLRPICGMAHANTNCATSSANDQPVQRFCGGSIPGGLGHGFFASCNGTNSAYMRSSGDVEPRGSVIERPRICSG